MRRNQVEDPSGPKETAWNESAFLESHEDVGVNYGSTTEAKNLPKTNCLAA